MSGGTIQSSESDSSHSTSQVPTPTSNILQNGSKQALNSLFEDPEADVTFQSIDYQLFHLQRKYLEANTGAFPGSEFDTRGEVTQLTEKANILELLFQFVYPRREPEVDGLEFETLAELAEAAEKYEVFHAMSICRMQMKKFVSTHPLQIISHAARHDYPNLIQDSIPYVVRRPVADIAQALPTRYIVLWLRYHQLWDELFDDSLDNALSLPISEPYTGTKSIGYFARSKKAEICSACLLIVVRRIQELKALPSVKELKDSLSTLHSRPRGCLSSACQYVNIANSTFTDIKVKIENIPTFSSFIQDKNSSMG